MKMYNVKLSSAPYQKTFYKNSVCHEKQLINCNLCCHESIVVTNQSETSNAVRSKCGNFVGQDIIHPHTFDLVQLLTTYKLVIDTAYIGIISLKASSFTILF